MRRSSALATTVLLVLALAAAGCGSATSDDEQQVRGVLATFAKSVETRDYQRLCDDVFSPKLLSGVQSIGLPCEVAMRKFGGVSSARLTVGRVTVQDAQAEAAVKTSAAGEPPYSGTVRLDKVSGKWKVSALSTPPAQSPTPTRTPTPTASP